MTDLSETVAALRELRDKLTYLRPHWRQAIDEGIIALEEAEKVIGPFSDMAGELFARNWNAGDVVLALDNPDDPHRVYAGDYFLARDWQRKYGKQGQ